MPFQGEGDHCISKLPLTGYILVPTCLLAPTYKIGSGSSILEPGFVKGDSSRVIGDLKLETKL